MVTNTLPHHNNLFQEEQERNLREFSAELHSLENYLCESRVSLGLMRDTRLDTDPREFILNLWSLDAELLKLHEKIICVKKLIDEILS